MRANTMTRAAALGAFCVAVCAATAGAQTIAITGGTVYPVSGPKIEHGTVLITNEFFTGLSPTSRL